ncbi:MAG: PepSY domain-containing protein [Rhodanobacteraceae bacterium]
MHKLALSFAIALLAASSAQAQDTVPAAQAQTAMQRAERPSNPNALSEAEIKHRIAGAGYKEVKGLEFEDGVWRTKARGGNDHWVALLVAPVTGKVYEADAPSKLNADEIRAKLTAAGYQNISDVEFEDGLWSAEADNTEGDEVELLVDPDDGSVVSSQQD